MPIPELGGEMSREQVIKEYMNYGWAKELEFDWVYVSRNGEPRVKRMRFTADTIPCGKQEDIQHQLTFLKLAPTGVIWTCGVCGKSDGPISDENGREISDRIVSWNEAWEILSKTGQHPPIGMVRAGQQRVRIK